MSYTFRQYDSRWGSKNYNGSSTIAAAGCGPTACADIIYNLDTSITPLQTAKWMQSHGYAIRNNGTAWAGIPACLKAYGCKDVQNPRTMAEVYKIMAKKGYKAVFLFRGGSRGGVTWTSSGHYLCASDYKVKDGMHYFYMRDPGARKHDGWFCYEKTMVGLIPEIWTCYCDKINGKPIKSEKTPTIEKKSYSGEWPTFLISKTREQVINDAITWARYIANDNSFHYGSGSAAHHNGCYFCGTQPKSKTNSNIKDVQKTYCCNPYIHAAFAHGGLIDSMLRMCKKGSSFGFKSSEGYAKSSLFKALKHPDKSTLKKGDVMCSSSHVAMVTADGGKMLVEAIHDDNKRNSNKWNGSISEKEMSKSKYNSFSRVYRLKSGYTNFKHSIQHGDISDDVAKLQKFLKWYGTYEGKIDRICGDATYTAIKKFQKAEGLKVTGTFGNVNLAKAKKVKK